MLTKADVYVVFDDYSTDELIGKWQVDFKADSGFGSVKDMTQYFAKEYESKGKKVMYLSIWPSKQEAIVC